MKPEAAPKRESPGTVRVRFQVQFSRGPKGRRRAREVEPAHEPVSATPIPPSENPLPGPQPVPGASIPKITRLLVLGYHFERLVREGKVKNYAEIARLTGLSRARVTQIVNLTLLAPEIQEGILEWRPHEQPPQFLRENSIRGMVLPGWAEQRGVLLFPREDHGFGSIFDPARDTSELRARLWINCIQRDSQKGRPD